MGFRCIDTASLAHGSCHWSEVASQNRGLIGAKLLDTAMYIGTLTGCYMRSYILRTLQLVENPSPELLHLLNTKGDSISGLDTQI
jgi:hypothetical protein